MTSFKYTCNVYHWFLYVKVKCDVGITTSLNNLTIKPLGKV